MVRLPLVLALMCAVPSSRADAQELFTTEFFSGDCYSIDPRTGASTFRGSTGLNQHLWHAMAKNNSGQLFAANGYWNVPYSIYEIDPLTLQARFVWQTSLFGITGMAFDANDNLFIVNDRDVPYGGGRDDLWTIDILSGVETFIGWTGMTGISALAYGKGSFWAYDSYGVGLVTVDSASGLAADVNPAVRGTCCICQTLCFSEDEVLYAADDSLFIIDTVTGVPSYIGWMPFPGFACGMEFLPNQPAPFSLGVQGKLGSPMSAFATGATPGSLVGLFGAIGLGSVSTLPGGHPCSGTLLDLNSVHLILTGRAGPLGRVQFGTVLVPIEARGHVEIQAVDQAGCTTSNPVTVFF